MKSDNVMQELRTKFGLKNVLLKHNVGNRSVGILVSGTSLHVGIALRHEGDQPNKRKARHIAMGRAVRSHGIYNGTLQVRVREEKRKEPLTFTLENLDPDMMHKAITDLFSGDFWK